MTRWFHARWERQVSLMVADALAAGEREATERHVQSCPSCAERVEALGRLWNTLSRDPSRSAAMPISTEALLTRVHARLREAPEPVRGWSRILVPVTAAAAIVAAVVTTTLVHTRDPQPPPDSADVTVAVPDDVFARMERQVARAQVARYLAEAQDVLVTVASHPHSCDREARRLNVRAEARRSRELLSKRAMVDEGAHEAPGAQDVMRAVERTLRDVALLEPCARPWELLAIQKDLEESHLLLKIDLVKRELVG